MKLTRQSFQYFYFTPMPLQTRYYNNLFIHIYFIYIRPPFHRTRYPRTSIERSRYSTSILKLLNTKLKKSQHFAIFFCFSFVDSIFNFEHYSVLEKFVSCRSSSDFIFEKSFYNSKTGSPIRVEIITRLLIFLPPSSPVSWTCKRI